MSAQPPQNLVGARVLLGVSSSIAAHRALDLASMLRKAGAEVRAVLTHNATNLIGVAAFDAITHQRTIATLWGSGHEGEMDHLAVTKWATDFVIAPASANTIGVLANGLAPDALGTFAVAWNKSPLLIAPAMNPEMWRNAAVQENVETLRRRGHRIIGPDSGPTACDDIGRGRLAPVDEIFAAIAEAHAARTAPGPLTGRRVLITAGPTREFADDVRCITNPSTGRQGIALAEAALELGAREVVLVLGPTTLRPPTIVRTIPVVSADDMLAAVLREMESSDILVFSAAVSDWKPVERFDGKEKKAEAGGEQTIHLVRTPDIAATANGKRRAGQVFVGFAAESHNLAAYAGEKMKRKGFAVVFANPINEPGAGFGGDTNRGLLLRADGTQKTVQQGTKREIARVILEEALGAQCSGIASEFDPTPRAHKD